MYGTSLPTLIALVAAYFAAMINWSYSTGDRAGWVQKVSHKGWVCKTWEGELALVSMPGAPVEKFNFTVFDDAVADDIWKAVQKRRNVIYTPFFWRYIMLIIRHIPEFIFKKMKI